MNKEFWLERIRVWATFSVVLIHVVSGSYTEKISNIPFYRYFFDISLLRNVTSIAVPLFLMITGYLLLNPNKELPLEKVKKYIFRMILILLTFGFAFCLIESFVKHRSSGILYVVKDSVINLLSAKSWGHMWYIYMLIGLYILTPILRAFVKSASEQTLNFVIIFLFLLTIAVPTINKLFGYHFTNFKILSEPYIFYCLFGHYVRKINIKSIFAGIAGIFSSIILAILLSVSRAYPNNLLNYDNIFIAILSMSVFYLSYKRQNCKYSKFVSYISKRSLYIYLVHTLFLNIINKGLNIYITQFPIIIGETLFFVAVLALSLLTYEVVVRIPLFRKLI